MATNRFGPTYVAGLLESQSLIIAPATIMNPATHSVLIERQRKQYAQEDGTASVADGGMVIHIATGQTGTVMSFIAGCCTPCVGADTIDVDLHKNGTTILSSLIELDSADAAYAILNGTISDSDMAADDVFEIVIAVNAGGGTMGQGVFAEALFDERP